MTNRIRGAAILTATVTLLSGCTVDRPTSSDGQGPVIEMTFTGGADFAIDSETRRTTPADNCGIVRDVAGGSAGNRSVDVAVVVVDPAGVDRFQMTIEGEGVRQSSLEVIPSGNPILGFENGRDVDRISLNFLPTPDGVLNAAIVQFSIDSPFTPGVTLSATATDTFANRTVFAPFELLSELARCNY